MAPDSNTSTDRPNIIFILMDDLGWRDLSCYGSSFYETPHLDRLAADGMRFSDAYAACPVCSPTRASILAGKYPASVGLTNFISDRHPSMGRLIDAPYTDHLPLEECSLARALQEGGYRTWHVGKWHLGRSDFYPDRHGFDVNVGGCSLGMVRHGYFSPWHIETLEDGLDGQYLADRLTDEAIRLIRTPSDKPFFLNLWYYLVHIPIQGVPDREALFWHYPHYGNQGGTPGASVRVGDYKLIEFFEDQRIELYHLREDTSEERNLAADRPDLAAEMLERLHAWQRAVEAKMPEPNPDFTPWRDCDREDIEDPRV